jgi:heptosyltransferase I
MRILAIRYSGLGDVVMLLQTLEKLKNKYENCHITLLTDKSNISLKDISCGMIDEVISLDRSVFKKRKYFLSLVEIVKLFPKIRKQFDMTIDFQNFGETATLTYFTNAKIKLGSPKKDKYNYGYTEIIKRSDHNHRSQLFSRIAKVNDNLDYSKLCLNNEAINFKEQLKNQIDKNKKTIGLNIGSTQDSRRWNENNFSKLNDILKANYNILIFIGPCEKAYKYAFKEDSFFIEDINLIKLSGAISICDCFISNDTGPVHIAAALQISTLTLFSTGNDFNVGALSNKKQSIKNVNINKITVNEVIEKLNNLI